MSVSSFQDTDSNIYLIKKVTSPTNKKEPFYKRITPKFKKNAAPKIEIIPSKRRPSDRFRQEEQPLSLPAPANIKVISSGVSPTEMKPRVLKTKVAKSKSKRSREITSSKEEVEEEQVDAYLEKEITFAPNYQAAITPYVTPPNRTPIQRLPANNRFILHFLLDGFLSNDLGNDSDKALREFMMLLDGYPGEWSNRMKLLLGAGATRFDKRNTKSLPVGKTLDQVMQEEYKTYVPRAEDCITVGGYHHYSNGGHATAFRIITPGYDRGDTTIIFTNTGQGVETHPSYEGFYQLYYAWKIPADKITELYTKLYVGLTSPYIDGITNAYKYQVDIFKGYEYNLTFEDTGVIEAAEEETTWMTCPHNWAIEDGILYAKPQISGTCTFHAVFWQLLLDIWLREGSKAASEFESWARTYTLEELLNYDVLIDSNKAGEKISCLQLLVRKYDFKGREQALQTLLRKPTESYTLSKPEISYHLPVHIFGSNNAINIIYEQHTYLLETKELKDGILFLVGLLNKLLWYMNKIDNKPNESRRAEERFFTWHIFQFSIAAVAFADTLICTKSNMDSLIAAVNCYKLFRSLPYWYTTETALTSMGPSLTIIVGLVEKLHSALPEGEQLIKHDIPLDRVDGLITANTRCKTAQFVRNFANYGYQRGLLIDSKEVEIWASYTTLSPFKITYFADVDEDSKSPVDIAFHSFMAAKQVNACIGGLFSLMRIPLTSLYPGVTEKTIFLLGRVHNNIYGVTSRTDVSTSLGIIVDLEQGRSLLDINFTDYILPINETMTSACLPYPQQEEPEQLEEEQPLYTEHEEEELPQENEEEEQEEEGNEGNEGDEGDEEGEEEEGVQKYEEQFVSKNSVVFKRASNVDPDEYYIMRKGWMQDVWLKQASQITNYFTDEKAFATTIAWLLYLWPKKAPTVLAKHIQLPITSKFPLLNIMFTIWLQGIDKLDTDTIDRLFQEELKQYAEFDNVFRMVHVPSIFTALMMFAQSLFYFPQLHFNFLAKLGNITPSQDTKYRFQEPQHYPAYLRDYTWDEHTTEPEYIQNGRRLITLLHDKSVLGKIMYEARSMGMPTALWEKEEDRSRELDMYVLNEVFLITATTLTTPLGEEFNLVPPQDMPPCMRYWCLDYEQCLAIPLSQTKNNKLTYYFLLVSTEIIQIDSSIFDLNKYSDYAPFVFDAEKSWHVYTMQSCGIGPVLNRATPDWRFLYVQVCKSLKITCLAYLNDLIDGSWTTLLSSESRFDTQMLIEYHSFTPEYMYYTAKDNDRPEEAEQRYEYAKYLEHIYDEEDPFLSSTPSLEQTENKENKVENIEERLAVIMSTLVSPFEYQRYAHLLLPVVYSRFGKQYVNLLPRGEIRAYFESISGLLVRPNQRQLYTLMKRDLMTKTARIRIALMGIGKSKVLLPMLCMYMLLQNKEVTIVQPEHLVLQTQCTLDEVLAIFPKVDRSKIQVISDTAAKAQFLAERMANKSIQLNTRIVIFDEIDSMYNTFRSEYNVPSEEVAHPLAAKGLVLAKYYRYVVHSCYNLHTDTNSFNENFITKFEANLEETNNMRYNFDYGLSKKLDELLAVPFSAMDTPVPGAVFSDIDLTAILTCLIRRKNGLQTRDFIFMKQRLKHWHELIELDTVVDINIVELLNTDLEVLMTKYSKHKGLQIYYLCNILLPEKLHAFIEQYNISFLDLMDGGYSTQRIGFSGTDLITLPTFEDNNWLEIVPDTKGEQAIKAAIIGWQGSTVGIFPYHKTAMWNVLCNPKLYLTVLIDADALLRKRGSTLSVVKRWEKEDINRKVVGYSYVYFDDNHIPREYKKTNIGMNPIYKYREGAKIKYYFDQQHIRGTDIEIDEQAKALTLVRDKSKLTDVAQAVFRLRLLGVDTQSTWFMVKTSNLPNNREQLYTLFKHNDLVYKNSMLSRHNIQNIKVISRWEQEYKGIAYKEKVKYFDEDIVLPQLKSNFGRHFMSNLQEKDLVIGYEGVDIQHAHEQEKEKEKEKEKATLQVNSKKMTCFSEDDFATSKLRDYSNPHWKFALPSLGLSISAILGDEMIWKERNNKLCFIRLSPTHCKIITIAEYLLLQVRNFSFLNEVYFRYSPAPINANASFFLAQGLCGKHLALHEQLMVITLARSKTDKANLLRLSICFNTLQYDMIVDFLNSSLSGQEYLNNFVTAGYTAFLDRWVRWQTSLPKLKQYWKQCVAATNLRVTSVPKASR